MMWSVAVSACCGVVCAVVWCMLWCGACCAMTRECGALCADGYMRQKITEYP